MFPKSNENVTKTYTLRFKIRNSQISDKMAPILSYSASRYFFVLFDNRPRNSRIYLNEFMYLNNNFASKFQVIL